MQFWTLGVLIMDITDDGQPFVAKRAALSTPLVPTIHSGIRTPDGDMVVLDVIFDVTGEDDAWAVEAVAEGDGGTRVSAEIIMAPPRVAAVLEHAAAWDEGEDEDGEQLDLFDTAALFDHDHHGDGDDA